MLHSGDFDHIGQGGTFSDLVAVEDRSLVINHYQKILLGSGRVVRDQYPLLRDFNEKLMVESAGSLLEDALGTQFGIIFTFQPIRSLSVGRKAMEDHLGRVKHELKSPLNAVLGFAELLVNQEKNNEETRRGDGRRNIPLFGSV